MSIVISIIKFPEDVTDSKTTHTFSTQGGSIGRGPDNDWVLQDPERFISSVHTRINYENGHYYLTDTSTNGTFFNGAAEPVGKGNTVRLGDGDKFNLGDYEFLVSVWQEESVVADLNQGPFAPVSNEAAVAMPADNQQIGADPLAQSDYFNTPPVSELDGFGSLPASYDSTPESMLNPIPAETDPLAVLDKASSPSGFAIGDNESLNHGAFPSMGQVDQVEPLNQAVSWPESTIETGAIPEDWDDDFLSESPPKSEDVHQAVAVAANDESRIERDKRLALEKANEKILAEIAILKKQAQEHALQAQIAKNTLKQTATTEPRTATSSEYALIEAMGLAADNLDDKKIMEINQIVGSLVRETIAGMMQVLNSRSIIKNEFRMNVTTIQPVENNPLKFSANIDDAMENMFLKDGNAYKQPVEAIKEGFEGIAEHQLAILAGIRQAFKGVVQRFDPLVLEQRFDKFSKTSLLPGIGKGKYWESYRHYYNELVEDMDNSFQHLFGYEFVQAYEEQLQKLQIERKTKKH